MKGLNDAKLITQGLLTNYDKKDDGDLSDRSMAASSRSGLAKQDMFGMEETKKYEGNPVKGKKYLFFTLFMVLVLSIIVIQNSQSMSVEEIAQR